jgi:hypothetical protein
VRQSFFVPQWVGQTATCWPPPAAPLGDSDFPRFNSLKAIAAYAAKNLHHFDSDSGLNFLIGMPHHQALNRLSPNGWFCGKRAI